MKNNPYLYPAFHRSSIIYFPSSPEKLGLVWLKKLTTMALDLKELEEELDKALAAETKESLTEWLNNKRKVKQVYIITWLSNGITQIKELVSCKSQMKNNYDYFTLNSPIYKAIASGTDYIDLGYGKHFFIATLNTKAPTSE